VSMAAKTRRFTEPSRHAFQRLRSTRNKSIICFHAPTRSTPGKALSPTAFEPLGEPTRHVLADPGLAQGIGAPGDFE